jgi:acyl dehydratase
MAQVYLNTVEIGDPIPTLQKPPISRTQIARFAAASGDYGPLHVDDEVARASGYGSVFAHGMIAMGYVGEMLNKWLENGRVAQLQCRFLKLIWPGDVLSAKGVVVPRPEGEKGNTLACDVWVQNQNNDKVLQGRAVCVLFPSPEDQKKSGKARPDPLLIFQEYVSPNKKTDRQQGVGGPADQPPPRPPARAAGAPVQLSSEVAAEARKGAKAAPAGKPAPAAKAGTTKPAAAAKPVAVAAAAKAAPAAKSTPPKPAAASKSTPPKPAAPAKAAKPEKADKADKADKAEKADKKVVAAPAKAPEKKADKKPAEKPAAAKPADKKAVAAAPAKKKK